MMNEINRRYIDCARSKSERSHPTPDRISKYYNRNQKIVQTSTRQVKYSRFNPGL